MSTPIQHTDAAEESLHLSFTNTLNLQGQSVRSMDEALEVLKTLAPTDVYPAALMIQDHAHAFLGVAVRSLGKLHDFIDQGEFWRSHEESLEAFHDSWKNTRDIVKAQEHVDRFNAKLRERAITQWGENQANALLIRIKGDTMKRKVSNILTAGLSFPETQAAINNAYVHRRSQRGRGIRQEARIMQGDLTNALAQRDLTPLRPETLHKLELEIDMDGFACPAGATGSTLPTDKVLYGVAEPHGSKEQSSLAMTSQPEELQKRPRAATLSTPSAPPSPSIRSSPSSPLSSWLSHDDGSGEDEPILSPSKRARISPKKSITTCGCALSEAAIKRLFEKGELSTDTLKKQLLRKIGREIATQTPFCASPTPSLCLNHTRIICTNLGLYHRFAHSEMLRRLGELYANLGLWDMMRRSNPSWFKGGPSNLQSGWRFTAASPNQPRVANPGQMQSLTFQRLYRRCFGQNPDPAIELLDRQMDRDGSIIIPGLFGWLDDDFDGKHPGGLRPMMMEEIKMYDWHYRARPGKPRIGWARNMWFSIVQQLVRQDPAYYAFYVFFRPDHLWKLVSFPYYAKSTYPGESTFFRHIDVNIADFVRTGRGENALQGSLALSDEDGQNCTELLLGMHRDIGKWHKRLVDRGYAKDGFVQRIQPDMWTEDDATHFGYTWSKQICQFGDVRLSLPGLPHGSTGPASSHRINILPWFVSVGDDHQTLDTAESGTWDDLSRCHRDFHPGIKTPSGLPNSTYGGRLDEIFPPTIRLGQLGSISDALVGRTRWNGVDVRRELDILFGEEDEAAWAYIQSWRRNAQQLYCSAFENLIAAEKEAFAENSYFLRKELKLDTSPAFIRDGVYWPEFQHTTNTVVSDHADDLADAEADSLCEGADITALAPNGSSLLKDSASSLAEDH
jgi:hypothetical protein